MGLLVRAARRDRLRFLSERIHIAASAVLLGRLDAGYGAIFAQGSAARSTGGFEIGSRSAVLENSSVIARPELPVRIGRKTVFGHRCVVVGATVGDLCEIGNGSILMPGCEIGSRAFLGEGTLVPAGMKISEDAVAVGRPGRRIRRANERDIARLTELRGGDLSLPAPVISTLEGTEELNGMGALYSYKDKAPQVAASAFLFDSAEVTGDVVIGEHTIIGAGVRIIGDSHGPVRIGANVQILENTVLHLLPHNTLVLEDGVVVGPGCMIHGCHIGADSVIEPGATVCDFAELGAGCLVRTGALVPQRAQHPERSVLEGLPAHVIETAATRPARPSWAVEREDLKTLKRIR